MPRCCQSRSGSNQGHTLFLNQINTAYPEFIHPPGIQIKNSGRHLYQGRADSGHCHITAAGKTLDRQGCFPYLKDIITD